MSSDGSRVRLPMFTVDSFSDEPFHGNPAAVCLVPATLDLTEEEHHKIAGEMNLSETAFIKLTGVENSEKTGDQFSLRWFTPTTEVSLCGHATLASAAVLFFACGNQSGEISFSTLSGTLKAQRRGDGIVLNFPLNPTQKQDPSEVQKLLQEVCEPSDIADVHYSPTTKKLLVRLKDTVTRQKLEKLPVNTAALTSSEVTGKVKGVIVSLKGASENGCLDKNGEQYDFVSRYFAPWVGIPEDPVTGSAHTVLAAYWGTVLGKETLYARQCSARGGDLRVRVCGERVELEGRATIVLQGSLCLGDTRQL